MSTNEGFSLGKAVKRNRVLKDMLQAELSEKAGISVSYLSLLEQDKRNPSFSTVLDIANALETPITEFLGWGFDGEIPTSPRSEITNRLDDLQVKLDQVSRVVHGYIGTL